MRGIVFSLPLAALVAGCAISKDGVGFASRTPAVQPGAPGILIVGTTGPLRTFDRPGEPHPLGPAEFQERSAGWASVQTSGIPLVGSLRYRVLVPASVAHDARFASAAGSFLFGATADLVAARSDRDGLVWIDRVLCSKADRNFESCTEKYSSGVFDAETGRELGRDRKPKAHGEWVDVSSYVRLSKDPEHHSASELDVRAINRCDDCKGSLPGSVQSSVPAPPAR
jgi:hypothetical protein